MVVVVFIGSRDAIEQVEEGVRNFAPEGAYVHVVGSVPDAVDDLCDVLWTFEFGNGCGHS
ncbi:hypothetical protein IAG44_16230 [Streptomyces roseirectus]|uniref:Uncharacterized protein n=1 Tax=Streptomyces roseirectus TaxID=2768066 RepID=A0A7H0IDG3_9ACTN|nr:hypothetical protein [Streptomyces roseirectus]QNP70829.1 hypothetical protein IAG44_16230 [Streptomyces roseirectus]